MDDAFKSHRLNEHGLRQAKEIADKFDLLLNDLRHTYCREGRELAICRTKLEEACFFAKKAMAVIETNQAAEVAK